MKLQITNKGDRTVCRFGERFDPKKTVEIEVASSQQFLALRAVRALDVQIVDEPPAKPAKRTTAAPAQQTAGGDGDDDTKSLKARAKALGIKYVGVSSEDLAKAVAEAAAAGTGSNGGAS